MKIKGKLAILISIILICIPTQIFAWLQYSTYEACNVINEGISLLLKTIAFTIIIIYITGVIKYIKSSKESKKEKIKNIITWLVIAIVEITFCLGGAIWVKEIGMETYWSNGERYQFNEIDGYISNGIRLIGLFLIIVYLIKSIVYFVTEKEENIKKVEKIVRWQIIMTAVVVILLNLATRW